VHAAPREEQAVPDEKLEAAELAESSARLRVEQSKEQVSQARRPREGGRRAGQTTIHAPITRHHAQRRCGQSSSPTMHNEASVIGVIATCPRS
jgi:hypothetical protein